MEGGNTKEPGKEGISTGVILGLFVLAFVVFIGVIFFIFNTSKVTPTNPSPEVPLSGEEYVPDEDDLVFEDASSGLSLAYNDAYIVVELERNQITHRDMTRGFFLIDKISHRELQESTVAREGPPVIAVYIFKNSRDLSAADWVHREPASSNVNLIVGDVSPDMVGIFPAVRYTTDGLYQTDNVIVAANKHIFMFSGGFLDRDSQIHTDFYKLLRSVNIEQKIAPAPVNGGEFPDISAPVGACYRGGCSGQICSDNPNAISTCEYRAEYGCYAQATCERQSTGACGWTETPELAACLESPGEL